MKTPFFSDGRIITIFRMPTLEAKCQTGVNKIDLSAFSNVGTQINFVDSYSGKISDAQTLYDSAANYHLFDS